jgi:hypothetical protein
MAEKHQTRRLEAAKEDKKKVAEQYQKDLQKIDVFLASHPVGSETATKQETKQEKTPVDIETIKQHLATDGTLIGQQLTPDLIANSLMELMKKLNQDQVEASVPDTHMQNITEAGATKRARPPSEELPPAKTVAGNAE